MGSDSDTTPGEVDERFTSGMVFCTENGSGALYNHQCLNILVPMIIHSTLDILSDHSLKAVFKTVLHMSWEFTSTSANHIYDVDPDWTCSVKGGSMRDLKGMDRYQDKRVGCLMFATNNVDRGFYIVAHHTSEGLHLVDALTFNRTESGTRWRISLLINPTLLNDTVGAGLQYLLLCTSTIKKTLYDLLAFPPTPSLASSQEPGLSKQSVESIEPLKKKRRRESGPREFPNRFGKKCSQYGVPLCRVCAGTLHERCKIRNFVISWLLTYRIPGKYTLETILMKKEFPLAEAKQYIRELEWLLKTYDIGILDFTKLTHEEHMKYVSKLKALNEMMGHDEAMKLDKNGVDVALGGEVSEEDESAAGIMTSMGEKTDSVATESENTSAV